MAIATFKLEDGEEVYVETIDFEATEPVGIGSSVTKLGARFDKIVRDRLCQHAGVVVEAINQMQEQNICPQNVRTEFGLQFDSTGNLILARFSGKANFRITLDWQI